MVAGGADTVDAVDIDTGKVLWHKQFTQEVNRGRLPDGYARMR